MRSMELLAEIRSQVGQPLTTGLSEEKLRAFLTSDASLAQAIEMAAQEFPRLPLAQRELLRGPESDAIRAVQAGIENFYPDDSISPYIPLAAKGPWIVTAYGAVVYDVGGYGMLGFGHNPDQVMGALAHPYVMANVMTPSLAQQQFVDCLRAEIGHTRSESLRHPYRKFLCLNSGSEAVCLAARIADVNAKIRTEDPYPRRPIRIAVMEGAFHGRTGRAAMASHSSHGTYQKHLASFRSTESVLTVPQNDVAALKDLFAQATREGFFIEALFLEPVMGEGDPGRAITRAFYDAARELTREHGSMLVVDSIQAGLRAQGVLSLMDYPGFQDAIPPDMETYSKAINAGNYPLSVLALSGDAAGLYRKGIYGNTMTTNPRALKVACAVLQGITPEIRSNIRAKGEKLRLEFSRLMERSSGMILGVEGTGLLVSVRLNKGCCLTSGSGSTEDFVRRHGVNIIHGGQNSLRLTPHFRITDQEIALIVSVVEEALGDACQNTATCCRKQALEKQEYVQYR